MSDLTHVNRMSWTHYWALTNFKQSQLDDNREAVLNALTLLGEAQIEEIYTHLHKINEKKARTLYENGKISGSEKRELIKEKTMSKRTIHRHLDRLRKLGLVEHIGYKHR